MKPNWTLGSIRDRSNLTCLTILIFTAGCGKQETPQGEVTPSPLASVAASSRIDVAVQESVKQDAVQAPLEIELAQGSIPAGRTPNGKYWLDTFKYSAPKQPLSEPTFVEARDSCATDGMALCSREQLDQICSKDPSVGSVETWTTSFASNGQVWTRGGSSCDAQTAVDPLDKRTSRAGLCCERKPAIEITSQSKSDGLQKSISVYALMVQNAMNARDPEKVLPLVAEEFRLYSDNQLVNKEKGARLLAFDLGNGPEFDSHLVRCGGTIEKGGKHGAFVCQTVTVRKLNSKPSRELAFMDLQFHFIPPVLKYDRWAVSTNIVRNYLPIEAPSAVSRPASADGTQLSSKAAALLTAASSATDVALTPAELANAFKVAGLKVKGNLVVNPCGVPEEPSIDILKVGGSVGEVIEINVGGGDSSGTMECRRGGTSSVLRRVGTGAGFQLLLGKIGPVSLHESRHLGVAALSVYAPVCGAVMRWNGTTYEFWKKEGPSCHLLED